jgi:hypothetical protein
VCKRRLVHGCPPLAHKYNISSYGIVLGVGISMVVLDTNGILVKYLAWENGGREKMTNQLCVLCVVKNCYPLQRFYQRQI